MFLKFLSVQILLFLIFNGNSKHYCFAQTNISDIEGVYKSAVEFSLTDNHSKVLQLTDSLLNFKDISKFKEIYIGTLNLRAYSLALSNSPEDALKISNLALNLSYSDSTKIIALRNKGIALNYLGRTESSIDTLLIAKNIAEKTNNQLLKATVLVSLGISLVEFGKTADAISEYNNAIKIFLELNVQNKLASVYYNLSSVYLNLVSNYPKALEFSIKAQKIYQETGNTLLYAYCNLNIGAIYEELNQFEKAIEYHQMAIEVFDSLDNKIIKSIALNYAGEAYRKKGDLRKAIEYYNHSLKLNEEMNRKAGLAVAYNNLGEVYLELNQITTAKSYLLKSLEISTELNDKYKLSIIYNNLASIHFIQKEFQSSIRFFNKSIENAEQSMALEELKNSFKDLSELYYSIGDFKNSHFYLQKYSIIKDSILNTENSKQINRLTIEFELEKKNREIESLKHAEEINKIKLSRSNYLTYGFGIITILVLSLLIINTLRLKEKRKNNKVLEDSNKQLMDSEQKLREINNIKDKLFSVISHDLRSPFSTLLATIELLNDSFHELSESEKKSFNKEIYDLTLSIHSLLENLLHWSSLNIQGYNLHLDYVNISNLIDDVLKLLKNNIQRKEISIIKEYQDDLIVFSDAYLLNIIIRNILSNSIKFTKFNGKIEIFVNKNEDSFDVIIKDYGIGINKNQLKEFTETGKISTERGTNNEIGIGLGLTLIKEFTIILNGKLEILSKENEGTTIILKFNKI